MEEDDIIIEDKNIINKEYYEGIKHMVNCLICLCIIKDPVQCDKCQHFFCSECVKNLKCPLRCVNNRYIPSLTCKQLLSGIIIKCECGRNINYDFYVKHKKEECEKLDFKSCYFNLKKKYELLLKELDNKKEINEIKHSFFIKSSLHNHPIEYLRRIDNTWFCNICYKGFKENIPSYHCTLCDFDVCYHCVKDKVTNGVIKESIKRYYQ